MYAKAAIVFSSTLSTNFLMFRCMSFCVTLPPSAFSSVSDITSKPIPSNFSATAFASLSVFFSSRVPS